MGKGLDYNVPFTGGTLDQPFSVGLPVSSTFHDYTSSSVNSALDHFCEFTIKTTYWPLTSILSFCHSWEVPDVRVLLTVWKHPKGDSWGGLKVLLLGPFLGISRPFPLLLIGNPLHGSQKRYYFRNVGPFPVTVSSWGFVIGSSLFY